MNEKKTLRKAIIVDRDGTLIEDKDFAFKIEDLEVLPGVIEGMRLLKNEYLFFIVTNQSGIGRGYYNKEQFLVFNNHLISILLDNEIKIERTFYCPHTKEVKCDCRKPKIKYLNEIAENWNIDLKHSWVLGDHPSDILFGINGGCNTVFLTTGHGNRHLLDLKKNDIKPTFIIDNFLEAAKMILKGD